MLVLLTMQKPLNPTSPIYPQLHCLELMNHLVGDDDITADKDFKHIFECRQNLVMWNKGIEVQGFCIMPSLLKIHLQSDGVLLLWLRSLLNPNEKQDVILGYFLLKEIWSLPPPPVDATPTFLCAHKALWIYGQFACHLILPYICVNLNLDEQLMYLSTVAHLALYLKVNNAAHTCFQGLQWI